MSRAVSVVLKMPRASPYSSSQPVATRSARSNAASISSAVVGRGSMENISAFSSAGMHSTAVDRPTPRGSNPTSWNSSRTPSGRVRASPMAASAPDPPGPPGLTSSEPVWSAWSPSVARTRNNGRVSPVGSS
jgi:hypothetical protein